MEEKNTSTQELKNGFLDRNQLTKIQKVESRVLAAIRNLNRLEYVGETLRSALNALAVAHPDWLSNMALC